MASLGGAGMAILFFLMESFNIFFSSLWIQVMFQPSGNFLALVHLPTVLIPINIKILGQALTSVEMKSGENCPKSYHKICRANWTHCNLLRG